MRDNLDCCGHPVENDAKEVQHVGRAQRLRELSVVGHLAQDLGGEQLHLVLLLHVAGFLLVVLLLLFLILVGQGYEQERAHEVEVGQLHPGLLDVEKRPGYSDPRLTPRHVRVPKGVLDVSHDVVRLVDDGGIEIELRAPVLLELLPLRHEFFHVAFAIVSLTSLAEIRNEVDFLGTGFLRVRLGSIGPHRRNGPALLARPFSGACELQGTSPRCSRPGRCAATAGGSALSPLPAKP
mmetsp:Transcript_55131/g.153666  ORF Transcript_55131/g.153666 Transcript_55131/m.153666 type:complete len:237 (+) Transcript_55131:1225-1935(+)